MSLELINGLNDNNTESTGMYENDQHSKSAILKKLSFYFWPIRFLFFLFCLNQSKIDQCKNKGEYTHI